MNYLLFSLTLMLSTQFANAAAVKGKCDSDLAECLKLKAQVDARIKKLQAGQLVFFDIASEFGVEIELDRISAIQWCQDPKNVEQPARLPTARELAIMTSRNCSELGTAEPCGAKGIVKDCGNNSVDCYQVQAKNLDGSLDSFYYDTAGYRTPNGDPYHKLWSSSLATTDTSMALVLFPVNGAIVKASPLSEYWFRCVSN
jgi:hypothetical protein